MVLTDLHDTDDEILRRLNLSTLFAIQTVCRYIRSVCDKDFWYRRFVIEYPFLKPTDCLKIDHYYWLNHLRGLTRSELLHRASRDEIIPIFRHLWPNMTWLQRPDGLLLSAMRDEQIEVLETIFGDLCWRTNEQDFRRTFLHAIRYYRPDSLSRLIALAIKTGGDRKSRVDMDLLLRVACNQGLANSVISILSDQRLSGVSSACEAPIDDVSCRRALNWAIMNNNNDPESVCTITECLIKHSADIHYDNDAPIRWAAAGCGAPIDDASGRRGHTKLVLFLIEHGRQLASSMLTT